MTKIVYRKKNFISSEEIEELNNWVDYQYVNGGMTHAFSTTGPGYELRYTTRLSPEKYKYPIIALQVRDRINNHLGMKNQPLILDHGSEGIVVSRTMPGGDVYKHVDQHKNPGLILSGLNVFRCNILTRSADYGGKLYVDDVLEVGELHCYFADLYPHGVTTVGGNTSRILWMFGCAVKEQGLNLGIKDE